MMPADVQAFSDALRSAIPRIRFVSRDYWEQFVDQERWKADCLEYNRRRNVGLPKFELRQYMRDPTGEPLRYWESLADPAEQRFLVWVEPPGWRPLWGSESTDIPRGVQYIENAPRLWFEFKRSGFLLSRRRIPSGLVEPRPANARETVCLLGTRFEVRWNPYEPEAETFGKKVYNVLRKLTVWRFVPVECESQKAFDGKPEGMRKQCLAGRHADAWTLKRRHNYLACDNTPTLLKSVRYRFRPGAVFTKAEYRQWQAKREHLFNENLRLHREAYERFRGLPRDEIEFESRGGKLVAARIYKPRGMQATASATEGGAESRVALELRIRRRHGRLEWI